MLSILALTKKNQQLSLGAQQHMVDFAAEWQSGWMLMSCALLTLSDATAGSMSLRRSFAEERDYFYNELEKG